jgi:hypothetical protein
MSIDAWTRIGAILATFLAPLFALQISAYLADRKEKRKQKFEVFQTLMQWRRTPYQERPVQALNVIDVVFHNVKPVRDAWARLYASYLDPSLSTNEGPRIRQDRLNDLLAAMADDLGYGRQFSPSDYDRIYNPEILSRHYAVQMAQTNMAYEALQQSTRSPQSNPPKASLPTPD